MHGLYGTIPSRNGWFRGTPRKASCLHPKTIWMWLMGKQLPHFGHWKRSSSIGVGSPRLFRPESEVSPRRQAPVIPVKRCRSSCCFTSDVLSNIPDRQIPRWATELWIWSQLTDACGKIDRRPRCSPRKTWGSCAYSPKNAMFSLDWEVNKSTNRFPMVDWVMGISIITCSQAGLENQLIQWLWIQSEQEFLAGFLSWCVLTLNPQSEKDWYILWEKYYTQYRWTGGILFDFCAPCANFSLETYDM